MTKKLLKQGDLLMLRKVTTRGIWIEPYEQRIVLKLVGEIAYVLYQTYRTHPFKEAEEITDKSISNLLGWNQKKVQRYRLILEQAALLRIIRYGTKTDGVTKLLVGMDTVALFDAGLPADILEPKHLDKIKKKLSITSPQDLSARYQDIINEYESNAGEYV